MPFKLVTKADPKRVYAGPDKGWIDADDPKPKKPDDDAQQFDTKEDAEAYAKKYGMAADIVAIAGKRKKDDE